MGIPVRDRGILETICLCIVETILYYALIGLDVVTIQLAEFGRMIIGRALWGMKRNLTPAIMHIRQLAGLTFTLHLIQTLQLHLIV